MATPVGAKLVTALITVAHAVNAELDNTQRQIDSEEKRPDNKRGAGKLEKLAEKRQEVRRTIIWCDPLISMF